MIPETLQPLLEQFRVELDKLPDDLIQGVYLHGSIALGAFEEKKSDIDFVAVLNRPMSEEERAMLEGLHELLREQPYGDRFDGVYIKEENLGKSNFELDPYFYIADGKLEQGHWDINGVTWWILKHHGITLKGKPVGELSLDVKWGDVEKTLRYNIEHYWKEKKLQQFLDDEWVLFCVETNARIFCTMKFGNIVSKTEAMKKAKVHLGEDWHPVLDEALRLRGEQDREPHFASTLMRAQTVVNFADHVRRVCEPYFQVQSK